MQLVVNFRNVAFGAAIAVAGYYGYRSFVADIQTKNVGKLLRAYRDCDVGRQVIIKRRILALYDSRRDYDVMLESLDSPSPVTQALAVEILTAKAEDRSVAKLRQMLDESRRAGIVKQELADAMATFHRRDAVPRLIELTDTSEPLEARAAAHSALQELTGAGAEIKFGDAAREHWTLWWRDHKNAMP